MADALLIIVYSHLMDSVSFVIASTESKMANASNQLLIDAKIVPMGTLLAKMENAIEPL